MDSVWFLPLTGGIVIGLSACLMMLFMGRIAGICSILANSILPAVEQRSWRLSFIAGLIIGTVATHAITGISIPAVHQQPGWLIVISGLLVGYGTQLGSGCTSGHSVCGLGRFSVRSLAATLTFMLFGFATVFVLRHLIGR